MFRTGGHGECDSDQLPKQAPPPWVEAGPILDGALDWSHSKEG